jgi:hypothetical protein
MKFVILIVSILASSPDGKMKQIEAIHNKSFDSVEQCLDFRAETMDTVVATSLRSVRKKGHRLEHVFVKCHDLNAIFMRGEKS